MISKFEAVQSLVPNAKLVMVGDDIIDWQDNRPQPTDEAIATEQARLQAEYDAKDWERNRQAEYP